MAEGALQLTLADQAGTVKLKRRGYADILLETTDLTLGDTNVEKFVDAVRLEMDQVQLLNPADLTVSIGHRDKLSEPVFYDGPFNLAEGMEFINTRLTAKFFRVKIEGTSNSIFFIWSTLEFYGAVAGRRR